MSSKTVEQAINEMMAEIATIESNLREKKKSVNTLCAVDGRPDAYVIEGAQTSVPTQIRSDQFYGQPLAASVRTILEMRRAQNLGAASVNEIYDALIAGGYQFQTRTEDVARNSLRNSLSKNTVTFHKLPNSRFGLLSWYPKAQKSSDGTSADDEETESEAPEIEAVADTKPATASN